MSDYIPILLSSAAIGALVSSALTLFGQRAERKARRREMLLAESVKMAIDYRDGLIKMGQLQNGSTFVPETARLVQTYYAAMSELITEGHLPKGMYTFENEADRKEFQRRFGGE